MDTITATATDIATNIATTTEIIPIFHDQQSSHHHVTGIIATVALTCTSTSNTAKFSSPKQSRSVIGLPSERDRCPKSEGERKEILWEGSWVDGEHLLERNNKKNRGIWVNNSVWKNEPGCQKIEPMIRLPWKYFWMKPFDLENEWLQMAEGRNHCRSKARGSWNWQAGMHRVLRRL